MKFLYENFNFFLILFLIRTESIKNDEEMCGATHRLRQYVALCCELPQKKDMSNKVKFLLANFRGTTTFLFGSRGREFFFQICQGKCKSSFLKVW